MEETQGNLQSRSNTLPSLSPLQNLSPSLILQLHPCPVFPKPPREEERLLTSATSFVLLHHVIEPGSGLLLDPRIARYQIDEASLQDEIFHRRLSTRWVEKPNPVRETSGGRSFRGLDELFLLGDSGPAHPCVYEAAHVHAHLPTVVDFSGESR
ncbi:UNVERIFIED_CONTAM: hypothetical protein Slati_0051800 [Sesamum latifolium]|uniref:Uncharacterized protein n=1 Tax=Sesamum latifolium TaxID=2727402 RepID=A0AAW2Y721_9LAMI